MGLPAKHIETSSSGSYSRQMGNDPPTQLTQLAARRWTEDNPQVSSSPRSKQFIYPSPWSHDSTSFSASGTAKITGKYVGTQDYKGDIYSQLADDWPRIYRVSDNAVNHSLVKAYQNLADQSVNLSVFIAELGETARMIDHRFTTIARQVGGFRKSFPKLWRLVKSTEIGRLPRHLWCTIPPAWLELQYGWNPLLADIQGAVNFMARRSQSALATVTATGTLKYKVTQQRRMQCACPLPVMPSALIEHDCTVKTRLYYRIDNLNLRTTQQMGLVNPAELVWELVPYSFVVDWAIPVGEWLSSLTADVGLQYTAGCTSSRVRSRATSFVPSGGGDSYLSVIRNTGGVNYKGEHFQRLVWPDRPVPGIYVKNPLSLMHALNGVALLAQQFR